MREIDRQAMGARIREIRRASGLRQWEMARMLGTTQSAVHKYEHGIVPEPRRLLEIARIGGTSVEWILTGSHWEGGAVERERLSPDVLLTARLLHELGDAERSRLQEALRTLHDAARALAEGSTDEHDRAATTGTLAATLPALASLLAKAERIHRSVVLRLLGDVRRRLDTAAPAGGDEDRGPR